MKNNEMIQFIYIQGNFIPGVCPLMRDFSMAVFIRHLDNSVGH
jgi:hypothetical protein